MKKLAIASASMALAAMPVVGVFAVDGPVSVTDNVTVVIGESCTFQATANGSAVNPSTGANPTITRNFQKPATLGQKVILGDSTEADGSGAQGDEITIQGVCNSGGSSSGKSGTWTISAVGLNQAKMVKSNSDANDPSNINPGTATSGTASAWAMKIAESGAAGTFANFTAVPATSTTVANGNANGSTFSFKPVYQVYVGTQQASGTYTGTVTYTIASTWSDS